MKRVIGATIAAVLLTGSPALAHGNGHGNQGRREPHDARNDRDTSVAVQRDTRVAVQVVWGKRDVEVVRTHYSKKKHGRGLPPGLAKKYARTGQLPPGWQKKMEPFPVVVERQLPPLPRGYHRGYIEGRAVIYDSRNTIIDVAVIF